MEPEEMCQCQQTKSAVCAVWTGSRNSFRIAGPGDDKLCESVGPRTAPANRSVVRWQNRFLCGNVCRYLRAHCEAAVEVAFLLKFKSSLSQWTHNSAAV